jgi:cytochrome c-type biogenesis protein CcmH/NrfG
VRFISSRRDIRKPFSARTAIKVDPKYSNAHAMLSDILLRTGDISGARIALTEAARLDKRWSPTLAKLPPIPVAP